MLICGNCGSTNSNDEKSCKKCGVPLKNLSQYKIKKPRILAKSKKGTNESAATKNNHIITSKAVNTSNLHDHSEIHKNNQTNMDLQPIQQQSEHLHPIPIDNTFIPRNKTPALIPIQPKTDGKNLIVPHPVGKSKISKVQIPSKTNKDDHLNERPHKINNIASKSSKVRLERPYIKNLSPDKSDQGVFKSAMTEAMRILQRDLGYIFQEQISIKRKTLPTKEEIQSRKNRVPNSLADILEDLWDLDLNIIVSALVHVKGEILALVSSRDIDEFLLSTIGNTLGNISQDMIHSLDSGDLKYLSLNGTKGIIFMAPVMKNVFLFLLTTPDSKSGVINIAKIKVKKLLTLYFADKHLHKTAL